MSTRLRLPREGSDSNRGGGSGRRGEPSWTPRGCLARLDISPRLKNGPARKPLCFGAVLVRVPGSCPGSSKLELDAWILGGTQTTAYGVRHAAGSGWRAYTAVSRNTSATRPDLANGGSTVVSLGLKAYPSTVVRVVGWRGRCVGPVPRKIVALHCTDSSRASHSSSTVSGVGVTDYEQPNLSGVKIPSWVDMSHRISAWQGKKKKRFHSESSKKGTPECCVQSLRVQRIVVDRRKEQCSHSIRNN